MEDVTEVAKRPRFRVKRRRRLRTHKLRAALVVLIVIAALSGGTDLAYASVKSQADQLQAHLTTQLQSGQAQLESGKAALKQANDKHDATLAAKAGSDFANAKGYFV